LSDVGSGLVHGAVSIVNAISIGRGAALGIDLETVAEVLLVEDNRDVQAVTDIPSEDTKLVTSAAQEVLKKYDEGANFGAKVTIQSEIPIGKGLKSSSAAASAVVIGTLCALDKKASDQEIVEMGVTAARRAGVTITGAYDDASACYFGGAVATDNREMSLLKRTKIEEDLSVIIYVPEDTMYTKDFDVGRIKLFGSSVESALELALKGEYWRAMTLNGLIHSSVLSISTEPVVEAMTHGALGCGLSGTGPAIAAVAFPENAKEIADSWSSLLGEVIVTKVNNDSARCL